MINMNLIIRKINAFKRLKKSIGKQYTHPNYFMFSYFLKKYIRINVLPIITLENGIKFNLEKVTDYLLVIEYFYNYYNIQDIKNKEIIIDVGANAGDFSIFLSKDAKKIYAFEPVPKIYKRFTNNLKLNKITNIQAYNLGIYSKKTTVKINVPEQDGCSKISSDGNTIIKTITWDDLYKLIDSPKKIDLLKLDCEGCEYSLLSAPTILKYIQEIRMELHLFNIQDIERAKSFLKLMKINGLKINHLIYEQKKIQETDINKYMTGNEVFEIHFIKKIK